MDFFAILGVALIVIAFIFLINTVFRYYKGKNYSTPLILTFALGFLGWIVIYASLPETDDEIAGGSGGSGISIPAGGGSQVIAGNQTEEEKGIIQKILEMIFGADDPNKNIADKVDESRANGNLSAADAEAIKAQLGQVDPNDPNRPPAMNMTFDEFFARYNAAAKSVSDSYTIRNNFRAVSKPDQNEFQYAFTDQIAIIGAVDPLTNRVRSASIITRSTGANAKRQAAIAFTVLIAAVAPELSPEDRGNLIHELGINGENFPAQSSIDRGNITYSVAMNKSAGISLTAAAKKISQ